MVNIKKILVATDFSEPSGVALAYGRDLARHYGAQLCVLHIVDDVLMRYGPEAAFSAAEIQKDLEAQARRELDKHIRTFDRETLHAVGAVEVASNVADAICAHAKANAIDLIVTGTHGWGAVKHFFLGSVAERVVRRAPCPVLTVHCHERDFIIADAAAAAVGV